jgi:hypothetical protein
MTLRTRTALFGSHARGRAATCALLGALSFWGAMPELAFAQDPPSAVSEQRAERKKKRAEKRKKKPRAGKRAEARSSAQPKPEAKPGDKATPASKGPDGAPSARDAAQAAAREAAQGVDAAIVKEGDTSVKVMQFSGLDIEGRLKSPQLLYFVNRVRAEFDRPRLPHRSFMPEVERSTEAEPLR